MSALVLNNDFLHLANLLENYLQDKLPLGREFEDLVTKVRARLHNQDFPSRDTFISGLIDAKPFLVSRLEKLKSGRGASYYFGEIYDSLVTQTDINELIPSINDLGMHDHPRDLIKSMIAEISVFEKRTMRPHPEQSNVESETEKRYFEFLSTLQHRLGGAEIREVIAWLSVAASHQKFNARRNIAYDHDGNISVKETVLNLMKFANMIAVSNNPVFDIGIDQRGGGTKARFRLQRGGTPDLMYVEQGVVKVGFASNSRCTKIEGNSFFRHSLEAGFINSELSLTGGVMVSL